MLVALILTVCLGEHCTESAPKSWQGATAYMECLDALDHHPMGHCEVLVWPDQDQHPQRPEVVAL